MNREHTFTLQLELDKTLIQKHLCIHSLSKQFSLWYKLIRESKHYKIHQLNGSEIE